MTDHKCGQCGARLVITCPKDDAAFCEKKRYYTCTECDHVIMDEEDYPDKCSYEKKDQ